MCKMNKNCNNISSHLLVQKRSLNFLNIVKRHIFVTKHASVKLATKTVFYSFDYFYCINITLNSLDKYCLVKGRVIDWRTLKNKDP